MRAECLARATGVAAAVVALVLGTAMWVGGPAGAQVRMGRGGGTPLGAAGGGRLGRPGGGGLVSPRPSVGGHLGTHQPGSVFGGGHFGHFPGGLGHPQRFGFRRHHFGGLFGGFSSPTFVLGLGYGYSPFYDPFYSPFYSPFYEPWYYGYPVYTPPVYSGAPIPDDADDYYLNRRARAHNEDPALLRAVADIEAAFRAEDIATLEKHVDRSDDIAIQSRGRTRRPVSGATYLKMTEDAFKDMKTVSFWLDHTQPASDGAWMAYGKHVLRDPEGKEKTYNVSFVLRKRDDNWVITEVSADPAP